jgi:hypothetical protein
VTAVPRASLVASLMSPETARASKARCHRHHMHRRSQIGRAQDRGSAPKSSRWPGDDGRTPKTWSERDPSGQKVRRPLHEAPSCLNSLLVKERPAQSRL